MRNHLKLVRCVFFHAVILAITFFGSACVTDTRTPTGTPDVSCTLLSSWDLGSYGNSFVTNPFLAPSNLFKGKPDEFVALDITLTLPDSATVNIDGAVRNEAGEVVARLYSLPEMRQYWDNWGDRTDKTFRMRLDTLERWYAPSSQFAAHKGRTEYVIILMGKNPLPRPASITFSVSLNGQEPKAFTFPLPAAKK